MVPSMRDPSLHTPTQVITEETKNSHAGLVEVEKKISEVMVRDQGTRGFKDQGYWGRRDRRNVRV